MADYAVVTMTAASRHCGGARGSAGQLEEENGLPTPKVQKTVSQLTNTGAVSVPIGGTASARGFRPASWRRKPACPRQRCKNWSAG